TEASSSPSDEGVSIAVVKDKKVHWERDRKRRRPSGAERRRRKRAAQEEAGDSDSGTPAKIQGKPRLVQMRPKGEAPTTDRGAEQTDKLPVAPYTTAVPEGPAAVTAGAWNVVTPRKTVQRTPLGHTSPQNTAPPPPSSSPTPNARSRHITMRFATRKEVNLPEGVTVEGIQNRINLTLSNQGHIRGTAPYVRAGHIRNEIGCIFLTLSAHTMEELGNRLVKARVDLLRELKLPEFEFQENREKVKIFVTGVPLADTGRGSIWRVESWTSDATFDGLRSDLEGSNNGMITAARPDI